MTKHSRFSPSATERDTLCPPSFLLNEQLPDRRTPDSDLGTAAHYLAERCLTLDRDTSLFAEVRIAVDPKGDSRFLKDGEDGRDGETVWTVDEEMVVKVQDYLDWVREAPGVLFVEQRLEHTRWCPDEDEWGDPLGPQYGTSDAVKVSTANKTIYVKDLKYGKGVKVFAHRNKQAAKYALGAVDEYAWEYGIDETWTVVVGICQPRLDHFDTWETTVADLLEFGAEIKAQLEKVFDPEAAFNPGEEQCRFCKAAARCKARHEHIFNQRAMLFDDETGLTNPRLLTTEELAVAYQRRPQYDAHMAAIAEELLHVMQTGEEAPGLKLVEAKTHRRWKDEDEAKEGMLRLGIPPTAVEKRKLISPNQAEKLVPKDKHNDLEALWQKPPGGPVIALADDPRDSITDKIVGGFEDEDFDDGFN